MNLSAIFMIFGAMAAAVVQAGSMKPNSQLSKAFFIFPVWLDQLLPTATFVAACPPVCDE